MDDLDGLSNSNGHKKHHNSPNRSPYNNNSPKNYSPKPNSPKNHSPKPNSPKNRDDDIVDTDGFRYVKYNRK